MTSIINLSSKSPYIDFSGVLAKWIRDCQWLQQLVLKKLTIQKGFGLSIGDLSH